MRYRKVEVEILDNSNDILECLIYYDGQYNYKLHDIVAVSCGSGENAELRVGRICNFYKDVKETLFTIPVKTKVECEAICPIDFSSFNRRRNIESQINYLECLLKECEPPGESNIIMLMDQVGKVRRYIHNYKEEFKKGVNS